MGTKRFKGVTRLGKRWHVVTYINRERKILESFKYKSEAIRARKAHDRELLNTAKRYQRYLFPVANGWRVIIGSTGIKRKFLGLYTSVTAAREAVDTWKFWHT